METLVWNPLKCRLETIRHKEITTKNTTWFDDWETDTDVYYISDLNGGLLIKENNYNYPYWIAGESRKAVAFNKEKAKKLKEMYEEIY